MKISDIRTIQDPDHPIDRYTMLEECMDALLNQFHEMDVRERIATISAVARIEVVLLKLKEATYAPDRSGSTVRRYEKAFAANAARKRKALTGAAIALVEDLDDDELEY